MDTQLLTKKQRRELRRQERQQTMEQQQSRNQRRRVLKWVIIVLVGGLVIAGLFWLGSLTAAPSVGETIPVQGRDHIAVDADHPEYNSNPPTSGWHYSQPTDWGVYQEELRDENVIHSLEHGGIWISYQPDIDAETKEKLEAIGRRYPGSVVVSPRAQNDAPIALASWGRLDRLTEFDENRILEFIRQNKNKSPEPIAR